jgi:hypothetical protein
MRNKGLTTLNKAGVTTWQRGEREAVLDLGFATRDLENKVIAYQLIDEWALTKDHIPIEIRIDESKPRTRRD